MLVFLGKTFIVIFHQKDEIISRLFEKQFDRYIDSLPKQRSYSFKDVILFYFKFWGKYALLKSLLTP